MHAKSMHVSPCAGVTNRWAAHVALFKDLLCLRRGAAQASVTTKGRYRWSICTCALKTVACVHLRTVRGHADDAHVA